MKIFLSFVFFVVAVSGFAQTAIKLNAHFQYKAFEYSSTRDSITTLTEESILSVLPSPAYSVYTTKGNFYEIGLSRIQYGIDENKTTQSKGGYSIITNGNKTKKFEIEFRYDYNFKLTQTEKAIAPFIGVSTSLGYRSEINEPKISSSFKRSENYLTSTIGVVPRIMWKLNKTVFLDLNIPINIFQIEYSNQRIHNPSLPLEQQKNSNTEATFFPINYEVRLGIGVFIFSS